MSFINKIFVSFLHSILLIFHSNHVFAFSMSSQNTNPHEDTDSNENESNHNHTKVKRAVYDTFLVEYRAAIKHNNKNDLKPIHYAIEKGRIDIVRFLLEHTANINADDNKGFTPIHYAVLHNKVDILTLLLHNKADVNKDNFCGTTALHWASKQNNREIIKLLLQHGARYEEQNNSNDTPLHWAAYYGSPDAVKLLLAHEYQLLCKNNKMAQERDRISHILQAIPQMPTPIMHLIEEYKGIEQEQDSIVMEWKMPVLSTEIKNRAHETALMCAQSRLEKQHLPDYTQVNIEKCIQLLTIHQQRAFLFLIDTIMAEDSKK